jgi:uncharacterized FAD-dependent dehydrogenase
MIRLKDITLPFDHKEEALAGSILERLGIPEHQLLDFAVVRKSIDARRKSRIVAVYTIDAGLSNEPEVLSRFSHDIRISAAPCMNYRMPTVGNIRGPSPVVVGSGPCGLFVALILAQLGVKPLKNVFVRPLCTFIGREQSGEFYKEALTLTEFDRNFLVIV